MFEQSTSRTRYQLDFQDDQLLNDRSPPGSMLPSAAPSLPQSAAQSAAHSRRSSCVPNEIEAYKSMYFEEQERSTHFETMKEEYEKLYHQFLEQSIKAQKEKYEI
jgi:hypothetical protein